MSQKIQLKWLIAIVVLALSSTAAQAVIIDTVPVGNAGNAADNSYSLIILGGVDYAYNMGKYEVTAGQYCEFLNAVAKTDAHGLYNANMDSSSLGCQITRHSTSEGYFYDFSGRPSGTAADWENRPVNYVSWGDAARFANWLHNGQGNSDTEDGSYALNGATSQTDLMAVIRENDATWVIPSVDEWYKAAYHENNGVTGDYFDYSTSSDNNLPGYINSIGNFSRTGDGSFIEGGIDPGNYATYGSEGEGEIAYQYGIGSPYYRTIVGEHENSASPYGTFDQGGNVFEYTEAHDSYSYCLQGGAYSVDEPYLHAGYLSPIIVLEDEFSTSGFRMASVPEPGSITLLLCGLVSLIWKRWR